MHGGFIVVSSFIGRKAYIFNAVNRELTVLKNSLTPFARTSLHTKKKGKVVTYDRGQLP